MAHPAFHVVVVDSEGHTAALLAEGIAERGHVPHHFPADVATLRRELAGAHYDVLVIDYHLERPDDLAICEAAKAVDAGMPVIAITSPGLAMRSLTEWNASRHCIDHVVRKPLLGDTLLRSLEALAGEREARDRAGRYAGLISEDALLFSDSAQSGPAFVEMALLFTDIRRSTQLISSQPLRDWFDVINRSLSDQSERVRENGGAVVKYTGDGLMASFRGRGRAHRALRCAAGLQELDRRADYRAAVRIGLGLAEGVVMTGFLGAPGRQQYDVIGATVHLAARLCSIAAEGEIIATPRLVRAAGFTSQVPPAVRSVKLRGFEAAIECVSFGQNDETRSPT